MKQSVQFSDAIHIMVYVAIMEDPKLLKSDVISSSVQTNASNVRKIMGNLKHAGLLVSQQGKVSPRLAKAASDLSLLDIFKSLPGENILLQTDKKTNLTCVVGRNIQQVLSEKYKEIQDVVEEEMRRTCLSDIISSLSKRAIRENETYIRELSQFIID